MKGIVQTTQKITNQDDNFKPTNGMLKWLETAEELGPTASITAIADKSGLNRHNWYEWLEKPGFVEWWDSMFGKWLKLNKWKLDAIGLKKAETDYQYWKDMQERVGNIAPPSQNNNPTNAIQINLGDEQLKRIIED